MGDSDLSKNEKFVNIHGHEIRTATVGPKRQIVCDIASLYETGFTIFHRNQCAKLSTAEKKCDPDFANFMFEKAKSYMLTNQIPFSQEQIRDTIDMCKPILNDKQQPSPPRKDNFFQSRVVQEDLDNLIQIRVSNMVKEKQSPRPVNKTGKSLNQRRSLGQFSSTPQRIDFDSTSLSSLEQDMQFENDDRRQKNKKISLDSASLSSVEQESGSENNLKNTCHIRTVLNKSKNPENLKESFYNMMIIESDVMVTHIDKANCCWVRDKESEELFEVIHRKINKEAQIQSRAARPWEREKVYIAEDEGSWYRCKVVRFHPKLTVQFLDYGIISEVNEIRNVSEEIAKVPHLAVRITFKQSSYTPQLEDEIRIKRFMQNEDGTYFVNVLKIPTEKATFSKHASPNEEHSLVENIAKSFSNLKIENIAPEAPTFFEKPPYLCTLKEGEKVIIIEVKGGVFYLRTRECVDKLKNIEEMIREYLKEAQNVRNVKAGQLVLSRSGKDGKYYRGVVKFLIKEKVEVELLDYVEFVSVELDSLKTISEELSKEPITYFSGGRVLGYERELDENCMKLVRENIKMKKKFQVVLDFDGELDLYDGTHHLSDQLHQQNKPSKASTEASFSGRSSKPAGASKRVFLEDIRPYKPECGVNSYLCGSYKKSDEFSLLPTKAFEENADYILRSEVKDDEPYVPVEREVCLCFVDENWCRCVVTRIWERECEVLLLDFGNIEVVNKSDLRKADEEITDLPTLALPCMLVGMPDQPNIENLLRGKIFEREVYLADIKRISGGKCHVELPSVYKKIRSEW